MASVGALRTFGAPAPLTLGVRGRLILWPNSKYNYPLAPLSI